jgi:hypothetical protein
VEPSPERTARMIALWNAEYSAHDIGVEFGISAGGVEYHLRKAGFLPPRPSVAKEAARIAALKAKVAKWNTPAAEPKEWHVWTPERQYWHETALNR